MWHIHKFIILIFICGFHISFAQMFFDNKGYSITVNGDTVCGDTKYINSKSIKFKKTNQNKSIILTPTDVLWVVKGVEEYYKSVETTIDGVVQQVFMKELLLGDVALYEYLEDGNNEVFYIKKDGDVLRKLNQSNYNIMRKKFLVNCDDVMNGKKIMDSDFRDNVIIHQVSSHNAKCSSMENPFKIKSKSKGVVKYAINIGLNYNHATSSYKAESIEYIAPGNLDAQKAVDFRTSEHLLGFKLGSALYIPLSKNFIYSPEINFIFRNKVKKLSPYDDLNQYFPSFLFDFSPLNLMYRTNKFKYNAFIQIGYLYKFSPLTNVKTLGVYPFISSGVDFKILQNFYSRIYIRVIFGKNIFNIPNNNNDNNNDYQIGYSFMF